MAVPFSQLLTQKRHKKEFTSALESTSPLHKAALECRGKLEALGECEHKSGGSEKLCDVLTWDLKLCVGKLVDRATFQQLAQCYQKNAGAKRDKCDPLILKMRSSADAALADPSQYVPREHVELLRSCPGLADSVNVASADKAMNCAAKSSVPLQYDALKACLAEHDGNSCDDEMLHVLRSLGSLYGSELVKKFDKVVP